MSVTIKNKLIEPINSDIDFLYSNFNENILLNEFYFLNLQNGILLQIQILLRRLKR